MALLRTFEVAARHESFLKAAEELHITPSAVSQQVKGLEAMLGEKLFDRYPRRLQLTTAGRRLLPDLTRGIAILERAVAVLRTPHPTGTLTVSTGVSFALHWMLPRLPRLKLLAPDLTLVLRAEDRLVDLRGGEADVAVRFGTGQYPGLAAELLATDRVYPVCSPSLLRETDALAGLEALGRFPLIHDVTINPNEPWMGWSPWLREAGLTESESVGHLRISGGALVIEAALLGQGAALVRHALVDRLIAAGRLIRLPAPARTTEYSYHLVYPHNRSGSPAVTAFRDWLKDEFAGLERDLRGTTNNSNGPDFLLNRYEN
ncbi:LysR substrate-binding domain-containing protein [Azospirillum endophyticum]